MKKIIAAALGLFFANIPLAKADIADGQFSTNQIFDVQYYWSGTTLNASNFIAPYDMNFTHPTVGTGQYFKFFPSTTNPGTYGLGLYNSNGSLAQVVHNTGTLQAIGPDALFYIGSGFFGTVITTSAGYSYGQSASFAGMDTSVSSSDTSSYTWASTTPLAAGQTASSGGGGGGSSGPNYVTVLSNTNVTTVNPTSNNSPAGEGAANAIDGNSGTKYLNFDRANAGFTIKLDTPRVIRGVTFTTANDFEPRDPTKYSLFGSNDGINWTTIVDNGSITLSSSRYTATSRYDITNNDAYFYYFITFPSIKAIDTYGSVAGCQAALGTLACDSVQIGDVTYYYDTTYTAYTVPTDSGTGTIANPGTAGSNSSLAPPGPVAVNNAAGSTATNPAGTTTLAVTNAGTYTNNGTNGNVTNTGTFTNNNITGDVTNSGTFNNNGTTGNVNNQAAGIFNNNTGGTTGNVTNAGTFNNSGTTGTVTNDGTFNNNTGGTTGAFTNNGTLTNAGTIASLVNNGSATNSGTITGTTTNNGSGLLGSFTNTGTTGDLINNGTANNQGGTMGAVTNNSGGTFTNWINSIIASLTNSGTATNNGTVSGNTNNSGTLTNGGTLANLTNTGSVTNNGTITGSVTNTGGTIDNAGTTGNVTNNSGSTFNNNAGGQTGTVTNDGTFSNSGTVTTVTNAGTFTNNAAGTTGAFTNSGTLTNSGVVASLTNTGTVTNSGTVTGVTDNSGTMTNTGSLLNTVTNSGTLAVNDAGTAADITNMSVGLLNFNGTGTIDSVTNAGTFNFAGAGQTGSITNSGTANISGAGTTGAVTNSGTANISGAANVASISNTGTVNLTTRSATIGNVTNAGTWNIAGAGGDVAIAGYTQTGTGNLVMDGGQKFNVNGPAILGGSLTINNAPTALGRYTIITGSPLSGNFDSYSLTNSISPYESYLKQVGNEQKLYVTPNSTATRLGIFSVRDDFANINNKVVSNVTSILGNDCAAPGLMGGCISINYGNSNITNSDLQGGSVTVSKSVAPGVRVGVSMGQTFVQPKSGNTSYKQDLPVTGGFIGVTTPFANGSSIDVMASMALQNGVYTISRPYFWGGEISTSAAKTNATAYQLKTTYSMPINETVTVAPYIGIRRSQLDVAGYTEIGPIFPLTVQPYGISSTDVIAGVGVSKRLNNKLTATAGVGVTQNVANETGKMKVTSEVYNLSTFETEMSKGKSTSASVGAGLIYDIAPNQKVGVSVGWQDKTMLKPAGTSVGISWSIGF